MKKGLIISALIIFIIAISVVIILVVSSKSENENILTLPQLFQEFRFSELNTQAETVLEQRPFDYEALVYNGLAYFYLGDGEYSLETRYPYFERAVINFRRAELSGNAYKGLVMYKLGQSYYYLGREYHDLALLYLNRSVQADYKGEKINEFLGLVYNSLGFYRKALSCFYMALDEEPYDMLYNIIARTHMINGDYKKAEEFYNHVISSTENESLKLDTYLQLSKVYIEEGKYDDALAQLNIIIAEKENYADAYYCKGNIYSLLAEKFPEDANKYNIMARAEWRKTISIDPLHSGANQRLNR